jgi:hypothetical protein
MPILPRVGALLGFSTTVLNADFARKCLIFVENSFVENSF